MCAHLLARGYFDAALKHNTVPRVGNIIDSALEYCYELLKGGGMCERSLPSTYTVWKVKSDKECRAKSFNKFVYQHPSSGDFKSMVAVDKGEKRLRQNADALIQGVQDLHHISLGHVHDQRVEEHANDLHVGQELPKRG